MSNFTNNRWLTIITLLLLTANIVTLTLLWTNKRPDKEHINQPPQPGGQVFEFITRELHLDSAQQETYKKLRDEHQSQVRPLQDSIRRTKDSFFDLLKQEDVSDSTIEGFSKNIGKLEQQRDIYTFMHFQKLRAICGKEQKVKFDNIIQQALHQMARPRGPRPGMGKEENRHETKNDEPLSKPGIKQDEKRKQLPDAGIRQVDAPPPHPPGWRPEGGPPPPGMRHGDGPPPPGGRMHPPPPPPGMRPPGGPPPKKDSL